MQAGERRPRRKSPAATERYEEGGSDVVEDGMILVVMAIMVLMGGNGYGGAISAWFNALALQAMAAGTGP